MPIKRADDVIVATMPEPKYVLPRARKIPDPKPLTKWEEFAQKKGIHKKKKEVKKEWNEVLEVKSFKYNC